MSQLNQVILNESASEIKLRKYYSECFHNVLMFLDANKINMWNLAAVVTCHRRSYPLFQVPLQYIEVMSLTLHVSNSVFLDNFLSILKL